MLWKKHYIGDRAFFRKTGVNPDTGQAWSPAEKDASIRLWLPSVAVILEAKDESAVADLAWFEARWRLVQDALTQLEARLRAFYTQHNGAKLADVGQIAREHVGNEKALNQKLRAAYQTDLGLGAGGSAGVQVLQMAPPDCQLCEDTVATLFCKQCQENFCQEVACSLPLQACSSCVH